MTGKLGDQGLDTLERRFQALRDQIGAMPEACRPELEGALQELSQAIAALRADQEAGATPQPDSPAAGRPKPAKRVKTTRRWTRRRGRAPASHAAPRLQRHSRSAHRPRPGLQHHHEQLARVRVWCRRRSGAAGPSATGFTITGTAPATTVMPWRSWPRANP